jgi:hypothetical protein
MLNFLFIHHLKYNTKMKKLSLLLGCIMLCAMTFAQAPTAILTIFSEDGYKFYLILNGQRQNDKPETNIRVQNLTQSFYSAKIIFEDKTLGEISKNIAVAGGADNAPTDVTYKIKAGKDGKQVLRYYTSNPITLNAQPVQPEGVAVYNLGVTTPVSTTTNVTQTTTTETVGANTNVNAMGVNINVNVPNGAVVQQTTTTTTTTSSSSPATMSSAPASSSACNGYPMAPGDYQSAKSTVEQANFEDSKLSTAKEIAGANCLYAAQVAEICRLFGFENTKLTFAKYAYKRCIDPQNYFKVNNVFDFDASKTELSKFTGH